MGQVAAELGNAHPDPDALTNLNTHSNLDAHSNRHSYPNASADIIFKRGRSIVDELSNSGQHPARNTESNFEPVAEARRHGRRCSFGFRSDATKAGICR
jgi:hypothetical protein